MEKKKVIPFPKADAKKEPEFIMEDIETGEREGCDSLAAALFGPGVNKDEFGFTEIDGQK